MANRVVRVSFEEEVTREYLQGATAVALPPRVDLQQFIAASDNFFVKFSTNTARIKNLFARGKDPNKLTEHINSARPLLHSSCIPLFASFLHHKKTHGTPAEKAVYEGLGLVGLVDRLLRMRPVTFMGRGDQYLLRDGSKGFGGFQDIGRWKEMPPLCLKDYLSYDEMKLSALLSVSSGSCFINDGCRRNRGAPGNPGTFQEEGVIVGMVGARLKKVGYMDWQDCMVTPKQNTRAHGYGEARDRPHLQHLWSCLWGSQLPEWKDALAHQDLIRIDHKTYFNVSVYTSRIALVAEILLAEASARALAAGLKAYVHVVGLGLGVWRASKQQDAWFVDAWGNALRSVDTTHVAHVDFSWIEADKCQGVGDGEKFPGTGVTLHFSKRSLHDFVPPGTLLVASYAWDGNSLPGNEYWIGKLDRTGDGAAACSSTVTELHNAHINANVCGANLHVAGPWGVRHIAEYARHALRQMPSNTQVKRMKMGH